MAVVTLRGQAVGLSPPESKTKKVVPCRNFDTHIADLQQIDPTSSTAVIRPPDGGRILQCRLLNESVPGMRQRTLSVPDELNEWLNELLAKAGEIVKRVEQRRLVHQWSVLQWPSRLLSTFAHAAQ